MEQIVYVETIEDFLRYIFDTWMEIRRWKGKPEADYEDVLMHSWKTAMLAHTAISLENNENIIKNNLSISILSLNHDASEACVGCDVIYPVKKRLKTIDRIEAGAFDRYFSALPEEAARYLKMVNRLQNNEREPVGRFFEAIEMLGYITFALVEVSSGKSLENNKQFIEVLLLKHERLMELSEEFTAIRILYEPFIPFLEFVRKINQNKVYSFLRKTVSYTPLSSFFDFRNRLKVWNIEDSLRKIIVGWKDSRAWPGLQCPETVLERSMKTAVLASILIPIEMQKRKYGSENLDGFLVLTAALVHNVPKSAIGVLSHTLKTDAEFNREVAREVEDESFLEIIKEFPEPARRSMIYAADLEYNTESVEGRFFDAIKILSYASFALYEYEHGNSKFREVLVNCYPRLVGHRGEFESFDMFYSLIAPRVETIVTGRSKIYIDIK